MKFNSDATLLRGTPTRHIWCSFYHRPQSVSAMEFSIDVNGLLKLVVVNYHQYHAGYLLHFLNEITTGKC